MSPPRKSTDHLTVAEVNRRQDRHEERSDDIHRDLTDLLRKLDERTDRMATRITVIFAVVAVLWSIFLVVAPVIRTALHL